MKQKTFKKITSCYGCKYAGTTISSACGKCVDEGLGAGFKAGGIWKNIRSFPYTLQSLPYGSVIEYRRKRYYKHRGLDGDILSFEQSGQWLFIKELKWKTFKVLFVPN